MERFLVVLRNKQDLERLATEYPQEAELIARVFKEPETVYGLYPSLESSGRFSDYWTIEKVQQWAETNAAEKWGNLPVVDVTTLGVKLENALKL